MHATLCTFVCPFPRCRAAGATEVLLGVELGDVSVSRQSYLQKLLGGYSFFDGTLGMVSLLVLIFLINGWLGVFLTDEEGSILLVVLTIAVVAVLYEEVRLTCFVPPWHSGTIRFVRRVIALIVRCTTAIPMCLCVWTTYACPYF